MKTGTTATRISSQINNLSKRLDYLDGDTGNGNSNSNAYTAIDDDHDYYLDRGMEPPRFAYYRRMRIKTCTDEWRRKTLECVHDSITQDELDYYLKSRLRESPEERYQRIKKEPWFHDGSWDMRGVNGYDGKGCNQFTGCVPECRYYPKYGRIEDEEVVADHNKYVESYREKNAIIDIKLPSQQEQEEELLSYHEDDQP